MKEPLAPRELLADRDDGRNREQPVCQPDEAARAKRDTNAHDRRDSVCEHLSPLERRVLSHERVEHVALSNGKRSEERAARRRAPQRS